MVINLRYSFIIGCLIISCVTTAWAQLQLPRFDVELKGGMALLSADQTLDGNYYVKNGMTFNITTGAHWQLNQYIGIGWIYTKSLSGSISFESGGGQPVPDDNLYLMMTGPDIRISTGRTRNWRPYLHVSYLTVELQEQKSGYRLAEKTNSLGGGIGLMRRISNKIYWNVIEIDMHPIKEIWWLTKSDFIGEVKTGLTVNFGKRK